MQVSRTEVAAPSSPTASGLAASRRERRRPAWSRLQRLKNDLLYSLARISMWLVARLPLGLALRLGAAAGYLGYVVALGERDRALAGLATAYPDAQPGWRRGIARRCFVELGRGAAEVCKLGRIDASSYVQLPAEARATLDSALALGRGVIWVTAHYGNWELLAAGLAARGYVVRPFAKESYDSRMTSLIDAWRLRAGVETIWRGQPGVAGRVAQTLSEGGILGVLMDQDTTVRGAFVPFFGKLAWTPVGGAEAARETGAPVLVGFVSRRDGAPGHVIRVSPLEMQATGEASEDDRANTAALTTAIETAIREQPWCWVWMHERWRTRPDDRPRAAEEAT